MTHPPDHHAHHKLTASSSLLLLLLSSLSLSSLTACSLAQLEQVTVERNCTEGDGCALTPFPRPLAVGATTFSPVELTSPAGTPALRLRASDINVIGVDGPLMEGTGPGTTAVFIENDDGVVLDFLHLSAAVPTVATLGLTDGVPLERLVITAGTGTAIFAKLYGGAQELLGDADESFTVDNPAFTVVNDAQRRAVVTAPDAGPAQTTLTFTSLGVSASLQLEVAP